MSSEKKSTTTTSSNDGDNGKNDDGFLAPMLAGASSGLFARLATHPMDTCKAKLQIQVGKASFKREAPFRSIFGAVSYTIKNEGVMGLYRGIGISAIGALPAACAYFTLYEASKKKLLENSFISQYPAAAHLTAGLAAEAGSCVFWVPIDVVKERLQVQANTTALRGYHGSLDALKTVAAHEGLSGLYKGYGATLLSFGPFSALYFVLYEKIKNAATAHVHGAEAATVTPAPELPFLYYLGTGAASGAGASFLTNPLDMAKMRLQIQRGSREGLAYYYSGFGHALKKMWMSEGFLAMFRGAGARMAFHAPATAITFALYEEFKNLYSKIL